MMELEVKDIATDPTVSDASDWSERTLCSDENCIGVIGPDGRCKECDKPYAGTPIGVAPPSAGPSTAVRTLDPPFEAGDRFDTDESWESRTLCSDENCIGVIGPGGRCKECGKFFEG